MYDIFFLGDEGKHWDAVKTLYPNAQRLEKNLTIKQIQQKSFTKMFWVVWNDLLLAENFDLKDYKATKWDDMYVHIFKNGQSFDGICLIPKQLEISKKEFEHRFFLNKKEIDIVASSPESYQRFDISNYDEYLEAIEKSTTDMFWVVWNEVEIIDESIFDLYFTHHEIYDRLENHVFKNLFRGEETYSNGITLFSINKKIVKREFDHRFLIERKEHDILSSKFKPYDIVFISYNEPNADENYDRLLQKFPKAKRVDKIKGIHQAHIKAAEIANSEMFWAVDGDAVIVEDFKFDYETSTYERDIVHVWQSKNPVNDLIYGYGGVKLLPRQLTVDLNITSVDMTTSISKKFKSMSNVSNITVFNTDEFSTWRSAFRECCKLASRSIERQFEQETQQRLDVWCSEGKNKPFGEYAIAGAIAGRKYGEDNKENKEALKKINDFAWLNDEYRRTKV